MTATIRPENGNSIPGSPNGADESHPMFKGLYSNLRVIHPRGGRSGKKIPQFLSTQEIFCPRCNRPDFGNVSEDAVVMCSRCLMNEAIKVDLQERQQGKPLTGKLILKSSTGTFGQPARLGTCERCHQEFRGRSNRQRFCPTCQKWNEKEKTKARMGNLREKSNGKSGVTL